MSIDRIIEKLKEIKRLGIVNAKEDTQTITEAINALDKLRWIPADEALPALNGWYMTTYDGEVYGDDGERKSGMSCFEDGGWIEDKVYAWMQMPEPYEG